MKTKKMITTLLIIGTLCYATAIYLWQYKPVTNQTTQLSSDTNKEKGNEFEDYVIDYLLQDHDITLVSKVSDYNKNGNYAEDNQTPDLKLRLKQTVFAVECKYRSKFVNNKINWAADYQIKNYKNYEQQSNQKVYIAIGIGGTASQPNQLYLVPLYRLPKDYATQDYISEFKIDHLTDVYKILL